MVKGIDVILYTHAMQNIYNPKDNLGSVFDSVNAKEN